MLICLALFAVAMIVQQVAILKGFSGMIRLR